MPVVGTLRLHVEQPGLPPSCVPAAEPPTQLCVAHPSTFRQGKYSNAFLGYGPEETHFAMELVS